MQPPAALTKIQAPCDRAAAISSSDATAHAVFHTESP